MEGPTPVSALLHAATMVAAGVYLIVRAWPIFEIAPAVLVAMAIIGGLHRVPRRCMAIVQTDIKKVLAYSTCSQLGYMIAALGVRQRAGGLLPPHHARLLQGAAVPGRGQRHPRGAHQRAVRDGRPVAADEAHRPHVRHRRGSPWPGIPDDVGLHLEGPRPRGPVRTASTTDPRADWLPFLACLFTVGLTAYYMAHGVLPGVLRQGIAAGVPGPRGGLVDAGAHAAAGGSRHRSLGGRMAVFAHHHGLQDVHVSVLHITPGGGPSGWPSPVRFMPPPDFLHFTSGGGGHGQRPVPHRRPDQARAGRPNLRARLPPEA